jgi:predicted aspartyl protease
MPTLLLGSTSPTSEALSLAVIDTGATANLVSPQWAKEENLKRRQIPTLRIVDALGKKRASPNVGRIESLTIGDARLNNFDAMIDKSISAVGSRVDVLLGAPAFQNVLLTLDYRHRRMLLEPGASLPAPNGKDVLPIRRTKEGHLQIPAKILGEETWLLLDTGHTGSGLTLSRYRLIAMPWASTPVDTGTIQTMLGNRAMRAGRMDGDITIGQFTLHRPIVSIGFNDTDEFIGSDTLRHFIITIDQHNNRIRFRSAERSDVIEPPPVRRLGFDVVDANGKIEVTPGSAAAQVGLQTGDILLAMNDIPLERWNYRAYEYLESLGQPVKLLLHRGGRNETLVVPLTVVIP